MLFKTIHFLIFFTFCLSVSSFAKKPKPVTTIIVDAGHGGMDPGASGLVSTEAAIALSIALKLGPAIEREIPNVKILYTRTTDVIPGNRSKAKDGNRYRATFANNSGADLFISLHCNMAGKSPGGWYERRIVGYDEKIVYKGKGNKKKRVVEKIPNYESVYVENVAKGTETFIWTAQENSHKGEMVLNNIEFASEEIPEDDPVMNAMRLVYTKKFFLNSLKLASLVQEEFTKSGRVDRGVKQRNEKGIWVLHATGMPSILVETGFISNKEEELYLLSEDGQNEIVRNITAAIKNYVDQLNKGSNEKKAAIYSGSNR